MQLFCMLVVCRLVGFPKHGSYIYFVTTVTVKVADSFVTTGPCG